MGGSVSSSAYNPILASLTQDQMGMINKVPGIANLAKKYNVTMPKTAAPPPREFSWQFPQYSQTWAFTPPAPSKFTLPPPFDASKNGGSSSGSGSSSSTTQQPRRMALNLDGSIIAWKLPSR